jgi:putative DNA methylase
MQQSGRQFRSKGGARLGPLGWSRGRDSDDPILARVDWRILKRRIRAEVRNREVHHPLVTMYRWWARRPFSLIAAILDAAGEKISARGRIADPFSGGGTVAIEAARRGYPVYAQDLNPWASWGLKVTLTPVDPDELEDAGRKFLGLIRSTEGQRYAVKSGIGGLQQAVHTFRVRSGECDKCGRREWIFPYPMLTLRSRSQGEKYGIYGCRRCGVLGRHRHGAAAVRCSNCGSLLESAGQASRWFLAANCSQCGADRNSSPIRNVSWRSVLVQWQRLIDGRRFFGAPGTSSRDESRSEKGIPKSLLAPIPIGVETSRLLRAGFVRWCDLYPPRQLDVLLSAVSMIKEMSLSAEISERLALCILGAAEMPGLLCRWDRWHPKAFEALSNHRYAFDGLAVEPNPLSSIGRGNFENRLRASVVAARWSQRHAGARKVRYVRNAGRRRRPRAIDKLCVAQGSSDRQMLPAKSVSLVITDPPYFDSVQYGELAALFSAWLLAGETGARTGRFVVSKEAVPNRIRKRDGLSYKKMLTLIFKECSRTLRPRGRLILTYHSTNLYAWNCLAVALAKAGFRVAALAIARTENELDHSKRGTRAFVTDLVIECVRNKKQSKIAVPTLPRRAEERELLGIGRAVAAARDHGYERLRELFLLEVVRMRSRRINAAPLEALYHKKRPLASRVRRRSSETHRNLGN